MYAYDSQAGRPCGTAVGLSPLDSLGFEQTAPSLSTCRVRCGGVSADNEERLVNTAAVAPRTRLRRYKLPTLLARNSSHRTNHIATSYTTCASLYGVSAGSSRHPSNFALGAELRRLTAIQNGFRPRTRPTAYAPQPPPHARDKTQELRQRVAAKIVNMLVGLPRAISCIPWRLWGVTVGGSSSPSAS